MEPVRERACVCALVWACLCLSLNCADEHVHSFRWVKRLADCQGRLCGPQHQTRRIDWGDTGQRHHAGDAPGGEQAFQGATGEGTNAMDDLCYYDCCAARGRMVGDNTDQGVVLQNPCLVKMVQLGRRSKI